MVRREARRHEGTKENAETQKTETQERRATKPRRRGAAAVEFALVVTLLFMLLIGLIDYGWIFVKVQQITQAARAGARAAVVADATWDSAKAVVDAWMAEAGIANYTVTPFDPRVNAGLPIKVEITVPTDQLALIRTSLFPVPAQLHAAASMAKEGPS